MLSKKTNHDWETAREDIKVSGQTFNIESGFNYSKNKENKDTILKMEQIRLLSQFVRN